MIFSQLYRLPSQTMCMLKQEKPIRTLHQHKFVQYAALAREFAQVEQTSPTRPSKQYFREYQGEQHTTATTREVPPRLLESNAAQQASLHSTSMPAQ